MIRAATAVPHHRPGYSACQAHTSSPAARTAAGNRHDRAAPAPRHRPCFAASQILTSSPSTRTSAGGRA